MVSMIYTVYHRNHETFLKIYINKIEISFKIKSGNSFDTWNNEITWKQWKSTLVHLNIVNSSYQENSRLLYTFILNKSFSQLEEILPTIFCF